jgi:hypothetical protein
MRILQLLDSNVKLDSLETLEETVQHSSFFVVKWVDAAGSALQATDNSSFYFYGGVIL